MIRARQACQIQRALIAAALVNVMCAAAVPTVFLDGIRVDLEEWAPIPEETTYAAGVIVQGSGVFLRLPEPTPGSVHDLARVGSVLYLRSSTRLIGPVAVYCNRVRASDGRGEDDGVQTLLSLPIESIGELWGIALEDWSEQVVRHLEKCDLGNVAITVRCPADTRTNSNIVTALSTCRFLAITPHPTTMDSADGLLHNAITSLCERNRLRYLRLDLRDISCACDLEVIKDCSNLQYLTIDGGTVKNIVSLQNLSGVRGVAFRGTEGVHDIAFLGRANRLEWIDIRRTGVTDLRAIEGLRNLEFIVAAHSRVCALPRAELPRLRLLDVVGANVAAADIDRFRKSNPYAEVMFDVEDALRLILRPAHSLRVCGMVIRDASSVAALVERIEFLNERERGFSSAMGDYRLEFLDDTGVLLTIEWFSSMRMGAKLWDYRHILMTEASAKFVCDWFDARGVHAPTMSLREIKARSHASIALQERYAVILPAEAKAWIGFEPVWENAGFLRVQGGVERVSWRVGRWWADSVERALVCFRLLGCRIDSRWWEYADLELVARACLDETSTASLDAAALRALQDMRGLSGVARYIFHEGRWRSLSTALLEDLLPSISAFGLSHPEVGNRRRTIVTLGSIDSDKAVSRLRAVMDGSVTVRRITDEATRNAVSAEEGQLRTHECSDEAYAALVLAKRGVKDIERTVRSLRAKANAADAAVLTEALRILERR